MTEQAKMELSYGEHNRSISWYPLRKWWQSSWLFNQDIGLQPFRQPLDPRWMDVEGFQRGLEPCSWTGYVPPPLFVPYISEAQRHSSEAKEQYWWRVNLDVAHFSPSEISVRIRDRFLEVRGKHEERPEEHGFIARCFTRKYRLPAETDATKMVSTLYADGILTVEALVPKTSVPAATIIPIKVEMEVTGEIEEKQEDADPDKCRAPESPEIPSVKDTGEEPAVEHHIDQGHPGSTTNELHQLEKGRKQEEETNGKPSGESHPSVPADARGTGILQGPSKHQKTHEKRESPDVDTSKQLDQVVLDEDVQAQSSEGAEITKLDESVPGDDSQSKVSSEETKYPDVEQEYTQ